MAYQWFSWNAEKRRFKSVMRLAGRFGEGAVGEKSEGKGENKKRRWKPAWSGKQCNNLPIVELCGRVVG